MQGTLILDARQCMCVFFITCSRRAWRLHDETDLVVACLVVAHRMGGAHTLVGHTAVGIA